MIKSNCCNKSAQIHTHLTLNTNIDPTVTPYGLTPRELYDYYNFPTNYRGSGKTIALIGAYNYPNAEADLRKFSAEFSLPIPNIQVMYPHGVPSIN